MIGRATRNARRILTVTNAVKDDITRTFGVDPGRIAVTHNGIDDVFKPGGAPSRYFLFVGNDKPHKNVDRLVEAFDAFRRDAAGVSLILVGADFDRFHDHENIIVTGFTSGEELASLYRNAIAVVLPSIDEGFGLPAVEAMASGTAVITSTARALVEVSGDAALHVDAMSPRAIADAMKAIAGDDALRAKLTSRGIERARDFDWRETARITRDVYRAALM
jgi:glycosyltransferase involved in cell wall biosynthesis